LRLLALLLAVLTTVPGLAAAADPPTDPAWKAIETFRGNLARRSPFSAKFVQTFLPEGFSTGEKESGRMALHLPDCLRWDYDEPYPKSFILCGDVIHYWNPGETEGQIDEIDADHEPGLDLLLVGVDELQERYTAAMKRTADGVAVTLRPTAANEFVAEATLELDAKLDRLVALRYLDPEGNRTEFRISGYQAGVATGTFNPPKDVTWLDEY
jgi:outer membrane lipoprotein-sorting protein